MSSIAINLDPLLYGAAIALAVVLLGTPLLWRVLRGAPHAARVLGTNLAAVGLAGLAGLPFAFASNRLAETVLFAVVISAALQGALFLILLLFTPKRL